MRHELVALDFQVFDMTWSPDDSVDQHTGDTNQRRHDHVYDTNNQ
jgi:hypothetical protein